MNAIKKFLFSVFALCFFLLNSTYSQRMDRTQRLSDIKRFVEIPFDYVNNFIILNVDFNEKLPLRFIFDTGAEYTILTKSEIVAPSGLQLEREFKVLGADLTTEITAYLARNVSLQISKLFVPASDILVFKDDYFQFEELTGVEVHGIIGANIFSQFVVGINYKKKVITLHNPAKFTPSSKKFSMIPISVVKNKPYLTIKTKINSVNDPIKVKLLLDTGASLSLLLYTDTHESIEVPPNVINGSIGLGLGGNLEGYLGRIQEVELADHKLNNVITNFQEIYSFLDTVFLNGRNGIIGNLILDRFQVIIDYPNERLYLKPTKKFKEAFKYDRSGLMLIASGKNLRTIVINDVIDGSPAALAGVQRGDIIKKVNWIPSGYLTMKDLIRIFQKKEGKKIKLSVSRNGKRVKFEFRLKDLI